MAFASMTVITRSREQADALVRRWANEGCGLGRAAETASSFLRAQWELWGDGRPIASPLQREAFMMSELEGHSGILSAPGTVRALASFTAEAAGTPALAQAPQERSTDLEEVRADLLSAVRGCLERIRAAGLVEMGEAAALLMKRVPAMDIRLAEGVDLIPAVKTFFDGLAPNAPTWRDDSPVASVGFLAPAGPAAVFTSILERIMALVEQGNRSILVCTADPERIFGQMAPYLASRDVSVGLQCRGAVSDAEIGRALSAARMLEEDPRACAAAADLAYSPWSGMTPRMAAHMDAAWRGDRTVGSDAMRADLIEASPTLAAIMRLAAWDHTAPDQVAFLTEAAATDALRLRDAAGELGALEAIREGLDQLDAIGLMDQRSADFLMGGTVSHQLVSSPAACRVCFRSLADTAALAPASYDAVMLDDLTDASFNAASSHESISCLREAIGLDDAVGGADQARRAVRSAWAAARHEFICVVPARDADRDSTYPSFVLEELLSDLVGKPIDASHVPDAMRVVDPDISVVGEDDLPRAVGKSAVDEESVVALARVQRGRLGPLSLAHLFGATASSDGGYVPVLSPSAIEAYVQCPYGWFLSKRIGAAALDEDFGAVEFGSFVHEVMATFYRRGAHRGMDRPELCECADALLDEAFDAALAAQPETQGTRLIACTPSERLEVDRLRWQLHRFVRLLALLPAAYRVHGHEVPIDPKDGVQYAGAVLRGRVDRIDVDDQGRFAVLDYKGSIAGYAAGAPEDGLDGVIDLPDKVQALIYAQAWRMMHPEFRAEAALYLSYKADRPADLARGSVNIAAYDIPGALGRGSLAPRMDLYLDAVERSIRPYLDRMAAGDISPTDRKGAACRFCPHVGCEVRP